MSTPQIRCKIWFEIEGDALIGNGRERLLMAIDKHGSLNAAAKELGIAYRKVWAQVQEMERIAPFPLFHRRTGGNAGGATELTTQAKLLLNQFQQIEQQIRETVDTIFQAHVDNGFFALEGDDQ
jgi:molybdate transport system regulatory protein